jgi:enoyl-CoA hydratase/carnithine racemase
MSVDGNEKIIVDRGVLTVVKLNNPEKRNAISRSMWISLGTIFQNLNSDPAVRAIILTGEGNFCSGADISEFSELRTTSSSDYEGHSKSALAAI